jgi:hypothetical protein
MQFVAGIVVGLGIAAAPSVLDIHRTLGAVHGAPDWWKTACFLWSATLLVAEQTFSRSLIADPPTKSFILSFWLKGRLHQLRVRTPRGPQIQEGVDDPFKRGYESIVPNK